MKIYSLRGFFLAENTYVISTGRGLIVIDPGAHPDAFDTVFDFLGEKCEYVLLTHAHFDHNCATAYLKEKGAKIFCHKSYLELIESCSMVNLGNYPGLNLPYTADVLLEGGESLELCGVKINTFYTPGHSVDGMCYLIENNLFSGDTLFNLSYGATHFPTGDFYTLKESIIRLTKAVPGDAGLFDGHTRLRGEMPLGDRRFLLCKPSSTIEYELKNNPIFYEN